MIIRVLYISVLIVGISASAVYAQLSGNNMLEYQHGQLPGDTASFSGLYDHLTVNYKYKKIKASVAAEQYQTPYNDRNYVKLTSYSLRYKSKPLELNVGNFYETIGRGLLLRSFEIPGALLEDLSYRSKQKFHCDIYGVNVKYRHKDFSAKVIYGKPLNNVYPPTLGDSLRRTDIIEAAYVDYSFFKQTAGASVMRLTNRNGSSLYGMFTISGKLFPFMSYYTEYAQDTEDKFFNLSKSSSAALYSGINLYFNNTGLSIEYKNYNNFILGTGVNEPPALVKEHTYVVLNRSTHVVQPINEQGFQIELYHTFNNQSVLTVNNTIAINSLVKDLLYKEYFAEYSFNIADKHDIKIFADYADDPFKLEVGRVSAGSYTDWKISDNSVITANYEFQKFRRSGETTFNHVAIAGISFKSKFHFNIVSEASNDAFILDKDETRKIWGGSNIMYKINSKNTINVFAGQRRGGPACQAGVCYEVLDFTGVEFRLTSRF